jgi:hypothetical protein
MKPARAEVLSTNCTGPSARKERGLQDDRLRRDAVLGMRNLQTTKSVPITPIVRGCLLDFF